jgi:PAS domain S-box-containing protein
VRSLQRQLPLAAFVLLTVVGISVTLAAYREGRATARELYDERLTRLADQLATNIGTGVQALQGAITNAAASEAVVGLLAQPAASDADSARAVLGRLVPASQPNLAVGLWDLSMDMVLSVARGDTAGWMLPPIMVDVTTVAPVVTTNDTLVHYGIVTPVREGRRLVGFLQLRQRLRGEINTQVETVLGESGRVLMGSVGGAWTDFTTRIDPPPPELVGTMVAVEYERDGVRRLGVGRVLAGTDLVMAAEVSESEAMAGTLAFVRRVGLIAAILVAMTTAAAWLLAQRITRPLANLRAAAEGLGSGDYSRRAPEEGHAEIAEVARTFNKMAAETEGHVVALKESEQRFRSLITATAQIVWWADPDGNVYQPIPSWQAFTGRSFEETKGAGWIGSIHPDDASNAVRVWTEAVKERSLHETEYRIRRHDGEYRWFIVRAVPILKLDGTVREWVATCTDISKRREAEEKLKHKELELQRSQRLDAVGRLAGGIAHDFNNLLAAIMGPAELAMGQLPEGHVVRDDLRDIRNAALRASELTRKLLAFGRQNVMTPVVLDVNEAVESAGRLLSRLIGESIKLELAPRATHATVRTDRTQFEQIIVNLAVNARDAMPDGGRLTIETETVDVDAGTSEEYRGLAPGRYVLLAVTDTGTGMDAETQKQIFEPFFTTKSQEKGTGLGLSTVYGIVRQSGGHVWVYSELGHGSVFKVFLPYVDAKATDVGSAKSEAVTPRGTETVLLAEDEDAIRRVSVRLLTELGYQVIAARNGEEAVQLAAKHEGAIDVLLSDVVMPEMNGLELWDRLRMDRPAIPALFMSGWASDAVVRHGILDGQVPFLQKPFSSQQLGLKIREILDARNGSSDASRSDRRR